MATAFDMELTPEERAMLDGAQGPALRKALQAVVLYGEAFGAQRLVPVTGAPHLVTSFGASMIGPHFEMMETLIQAGLRTPRPFSVDPRPVDHRNVPSNLLERLLFSFVYGKQSYYEAQLAATGLKDANAFTCACYLPEVGNIPEPGAILAWSESSAVVYANSVLAARSNRNSGGIDILCNIVGKAPLFGLLTDKGRRATWHVQVATSRRPNAQVLGSAIGMRVVEDVPYITGLDAHLGPGLEAGQADYLKDMGAASASNGAVGLYHVEGITPEAVAQGRALLVPDHRTYVIDDAELDRVMAGYPILWKQRDARPRLCFIGCPHLSLGQLHLWSEEIPAALERAGQKRVRVPTVLCSAPDVLQRFASDTAAGSRLAEAGVRLTSICPLMYMNNPLAGKKPVITNSNKLRTYSGARFFLDEQVLRILASGRIEEG